MAVQGAQMILWIASQVLDAVYRSVLSVSLYVLSCCSLLHSCLFFPVVLQKSVLCSVILKMHVDMSPQRAPTSLTPCPNLLETLASPLLWFVSPPVNLFLYRSPFTAPLCVWITCLVLRLCCSCLLLLIRPSGAPLCHLEREGGERDECSRMWFSLRHC